MQKKTLNKAGLSLQPITVRIRPLIKWGFIDRIVIEAMAVNNDTKGLFGEDDYSYFKGIPFFVLLVIAISGLITGNIYISLIVPILLSGILIQRYFIISDGLDVIGRMQETKDSIESCLVHIHSPGVHKIEYNTDYIQPLIVDYIKRGERISGRQLINIYIQLRHATKHIFLKSTNKTKHSLSKEDKKAEFSKIFHHTSDSNNSEDNFELDILSEAPKKDQELVKRASDIKNALTDMDLNLSKNTNIKQVNSNLNNVELSKVIREKISNKASIPNNIFNKNPQPTSYDESKIIPQENKAEAKIDVETEIEAAQDEYNTDYEDDNSEVSDDFEDFPDDEKNEDGEIYDDDELVKMIKDIEKEDIRK